MTKLTTYFKNLTQEDLFRPTQLPIVEYLVNCFTSSQFLLLEMLNHLIFCPNTRSTLKDEIEARECMTEERAAYEARRRKELHDEAMQNPDQARSPEKEFVRYYRAKTSAQTNVLKRRRPELFELKPCFYVALSQRILPLALNIVSSGTQYDYSVYAITLTVAQILKCAHQNIADLLSTFRVQMVWFEEALEKINKNPICSEISNSMFTSTGTVLPKGLWLAKFICDASGRLKNRDKEFAERFKEYTVRLHPALARALNYIIATKSHNRHCIFELAHMYGGIQTKQSQSQSPQGMVATIYL